MVTTRTATVESVVTHARKRGWRLCALLLLPIVTTANALELEPNLSVGVLHTDNLTLSRENPEAQTIYVLRPSLLFTRASNRLTAAVLYQVEGYRYQERGDSEAYDSLDARMTFEPIPDRFMLNFAANRMQVVRDPENTVPMDDFAISINRLELEDLSFGPEFEVPVGTNAVVGGDFLRTWVEYDEQGGLNDLTRDEGRVYVNNYRRGSGMTWAANFSTDKVAYNDPQFLPYDYRQATLELGSWVTPQMRVFVLGGRESPWDNPLVSEIEDTMYEVGFARAGGRLGAELAVGERSFGSTFRAAITHLFERGRSAFTYLEYPLTNAADRYRRGGLIDPDEPGDYLTDPVSAERYIAKRLQWDYDLNLARTDVRLRVFGDDRRERTTTDGTPLPGESQVGATAFLMWRLGARTELVVRGLRAEREFEEDRRIETTMGSVGTNYDLGPRTQLSLFYETWHERSDAMTGGRFYRANVLTLTLGRTFEP